MWPNRTSQSTTDDETETTPGGLDAVSRSALADALATIGDRWTLLVVAALLDGPRRFGDLQDEVIAPKAAATMAETSDQALMRHQYQRSR